MDKKAVIALDIDGTITDDNHLIPDKVVDYLRELTNQYELFLITGRSFIFAETSIDKLDFPYKLAVQNGADILSMPEKKRLFRFYIDKKTLLLIDELTRSYSEDLIVYAGIDKGDFCYYRPQNMSPYLLRHCNRLMRFSPTEWVAASSYELIDQETFPLLKYMGENELMARIENELKGVDGIATSVIRDPLDETLSLLLVTHIEANKGRALKNLMQAFSLDLPIIAAGDDKNDIPMLDEADVSIVVETAPKFMHPLADILAKPSNEMGIINALDLACKKL